MKTENSLEIAVICANNQNRSMAAHGALLQNEIPAESFGTNLEMKLPGKTIKTPNSYGFGITYEEIYEDLVSQDKEYYTKTGLLSLLKRNMGIKKAPQRFQDVAGFFDLIICCDKKCFDTLHQFLLDKDGDKNRVAYLVNFSIPDTPSDAEIGAKGILELCRRAVEGESLSNILLSIGGDQKEYPIIYTVVPY